MAREFLLYTQSETNEKLAQGILNCEQELAHYDHAVATHESAIAELGDISWDETTEKYRGMGRDQMVAIAEQDGLTQEQMLYVAKLLELDYRKLNLNACIVEIGKVENNYKYFLSALPAGSARDTAFAAVIAKSANNNTP
jgi:hypothetical protein